MDEPRIDQRKLSWLDGGCSNKKLAADPYLHQLWPFPKIEEKVKRSVAVIKSPLIKACTAVRYAYVRGGRRD